jgi:hypothetical protein
MIRNLPTTPHSTLNFISHSTVNSHQVPRHLNLTLTQIAFKKRLIKNVSSCMTNMNNHEIALPGLVNAWISSFSNRVP